MRATCEFSQSKEALTLPPIKVKIFKTKHDITIKISDLGGGIPRELSGKVFNYMYSTAPKVIDQIKLLSLSTGQLSLSLSRSGPGARHYNSFFRRLTFLRAEAHMVPASPLRTSPCTASATASLCPGCTRAISWATSRSQVLTDTGPMCTSTSRGCPTWPRRTSPCTTPSPAPGSRTWRRRWQTGQITRGSRGGKY